MGTVGAVVGVIGFAGAAHHVRSQMIFKGGKLAATWSKCLASSACLGPALGAMLITGVASALLTHSINECVSSQQQLDQYDKYMNSLKASLDGQNRDRNDECANEIDKAFKACYTYCAQFREKSTQFIGELHEAKKQHDAALKVIADLRDSNPVLCQQMLPALMIGVTQSRTVILTKID